MNIGHDQVKNSCRRLVDVAGDQPCTDKMACISHRAHISPVDRAAEQPRYAVAVSATTYCPNNRLLHDT